MKHTMFTVQLHKRGVVLVVIGALLLGVLLFAGGYLAGMRHGSGAIALRKPALPAKPKPPAVAAPKATIAVPKAPAHPPEQLAIRAGLFMTSEEATAFAQQLLARKLQATVAASPTQSGAMLYSVSIGQYTNRRDAAAAAEALHRDLGIDGAIVKVQQAPLSR